MRKQKYTPVACSNAPCIGRSNTEGDAEASGIMLNEKGEQTIMKLKADVCVVSK